MTIPQPTIRARAPLGRGPITSQMQPAQPPQRTGIAPANRAPAPAANPVRQAPRAPGGVTGYAAIRAQHEQQKQEEARRAQQRSEGYLPHRFFLPSPNKPGVRPEDLEASIIILDHEPQFAAFEHAFPNPRTGKFGKGAFEVLCLSGEGHCPACDADEKDPYFALFLTVIDQRPYTKDNGQVIPHTKKLLVVKNKNQDWFYRQFERRGTLRGMQVLMVRNDHRGAGHGNPEFIELYPEEDIMAAFGHPAVMAQDGTTVIKQENEDCYPVNYAVAFPKPDYQEMLERFGGQPASGSGTDYARTFGSDAGQFANTQTRIQPAGGGQRARIGAVTSQQRTQMVGTDADQGDYGGDDDMGGQGDDIPDNFAPGNQYHAPQGGGAATDPNDIPL